ncbi:MAG TPA: hypothetical protein VFG20_07310, partial [Planctomycetaceae bacterium]|nr:hypothetical protein [Planctomycetaceae bacterium]
MRMPRRLPNVLSSLMLCLFSAVHFSPVHAAEDPPDAATIVRRLKSNQESVRKSAVPLVEWQKGHDEEYLTALDDLIAGTLKRPVLDSHLMAVEKLTDCPLPGGIEAVAQALDAFDWRLVMTAVEVLGKKKADSQAANIAKVWARPDAQRYYALR